MNIKQDARALRIARYADWLKDDADGLARNLTEPKHEPIQGAAKLLATAREQVALSLSRIDRAIELHKVNERENA